MKVWDQVDSQYKGMHEVRVKEAERSKREQQAVVVRQWEAKYVAKGKLELWTQGPNGTKLFVKQQVHPGQYAYRTCYDLSLNEKTSKVVFKCGQKAAKKNKWVCAISTVKQM